MTRDCLFLRFFEVRILQKVVAGDFEFKEEDWKNRTPSAKQMVFQMLQTNPNTRLSAEEALECEWMGLDDGKVHVCDLSLLKERMRSLRDSIKSGKIAKGVSKSSPDTFQDDGNLNDDDVEEVLFDQKYVLGEEVRRDRQCDLGVALVHFCF
jgi:hypothetical protein